MAHCKVEKESGEPSKRRFKSICVFGGSNLGKDDEFVLAANELGKELAARKIHIVYGGGIHGLRGCVATAACIRGSKVLGIHLQESVDKNISYSSVGNELKVSSLPARMGYMFHSAEAFIALPGGLETFDGISSVAYWAKLNFHKKPLGLLNINGFYDGLLSLLDHAVKQEFITQAIRGTITSASTADQLIDQLQICGLQPDPLLKLIDWELLNSDNKHKPDWEPLNSSKKHKPDTTLRL